MNDNIESWSRTRRASAHSMTMSSDTASEAGSIGPSSFTENLTLYLNGQREYRPASHLADRSSPAEDNSHHSQLLSGTSRANDDGIELTGRQSMNVADKSQADQAVTTNPERNASSSSKEAGQPSGPGEGYESSQSAILEGERWIHRAEYDKVLEQNQQLRLELEIYNKDQTPKGEVEKNSRATSPRMEEVDARVEATRRQAEVHLLRVHELESKLAENIASLKASREREAESEKKAQELLIQLADSEAEARKELDDQSLIEELEDDLERTRQELDRMIKDKRRCERQLDFAQSDLKFERDRNEELESQVKKARHVAAEAETLSPTNQRINIADSHSDEEHQQLKDALGRTDLRVKTLESKLLRFVARSDDEHDAFNIEDDARCELDADALMQATKRIRVLEAHERELKSDLLATQGERDRLKHQLHESESVRHERLLDIERLREKIGALEDVKAKMGRVLMYQWGKEEVGEIERSRQDSAKERGMGYQYKYYNKNGTSKKVKLPA